jgi:hypothetical protein
MARYSPENAHLRIYTREKATDDWVERPSPVMLAGEPEWSADKITSLRISVPLRVQGPNQGYTVPDWKHHWVLVTYEPPTGNTPPHPNAGVETDIWYGQFVDHTIDEESEVVYWAARDVKSVLDRITIGVTYAEEPALNECQQTWWRTPNRGLGGEEVRTRNIRSVTDYNLDPGSDNYRQKEGDAADEAYVFGKDVQSTLNRYPWTAEELLDHLLKVYTPRRYDGYSVPFFRLKLSSAAQSMLADTVREWPGLEGSTVWEAIQSIIHASGPLSAVEDWAPTDRLGLDLKVFSRDKADAGSWQDTHNLMQDTTSPDLDPGRVQIRQQDVPTAVRAVGDRVKLTFTAEGPEASTWFADYPELEPAWTDAAQSDYDAAKASGENVNDRYEDVYRAFVIRWTQAGLDHHFGEPSTASESDAELGDMVETPADTWWNRSPGLIEMRRRLLYQQGYEYTSQGAGALSVDTEAPESAGGEPLKAWYVPPSEDPDFDSPKRLGGGYDVDPLDGRWGVRLPDGHRGPDGSEPRLDSQPSAMSHPRWKYVVVTVCATFAVRPWFMATEPLEDDYRYVHTERVEGARWEAALPYAIRTFDSSGNAVHVWGVLQNDMPQLRRRANRVLAIQRGGLATGTFHHKTVMPAKFSVADYVNRWGDRPVDAPIMTIRHNLTKSEDWGTKMTTGEPWTRRRT